MIGAPSAARNGDAGNDLKRTGTDAGRETTMDR